MLNITLENDSIITGKGPARATVTFATALEAYSEAASLSLHFDGDVVVDMGPDGLRSFTVVHPDGTRTVCTLEVVKA